jgi:hypothetical protein
MIDLYSWPAGQERVVDINVLRALAPPSLRPRSQASGSQARTPQPRWSRRHSAWSHHGAGSVELRALTRNHGPTIDE